MHNRGEKHPWKNVEKYTSGLYLQAHIATATAAATATATATALLLSMSREVAGE